MKKLESLKDCLEERLEKAKYTRREGSPGNYKYFYGKEKKSKTTTTSSKTVGQRINATYKRLSDANDRVAVVSKTANGDIRGAIRERDAIQRELDYLKEMQKRKESVTTQKYPGYSENFTPYDKQAIENLNPGMRSRIERAFSLGMKGFSYDRDSVKSVTKRSTIIWDLTNQWLRSRENKQ